MGYARDNAGSGEELARLMPLARCLDALELRGAATTVIEFARRPLSSTRVVRKCEYELRRHLRRENADLQRAAAGMLLLALKQLGRSEVMADKATVPPVL